MNDRCGVGRVGRYWLSGAATLASLLLVTACGGGGGGGPLASEASLDASDSQILVEPSSTPALAEMCDRLGAAILEKCEGTDYSVVHIPRDSSVQDFLKKIEDEPCVRDATPDHKVNLPEGKGSTIPAFVEEDPGTIQSQAALGRIGAIAARARGLQGEGEIIAVIDTGIDVHHPILEGHMLLPGFDAIDGGDDVSDEGNGKDDNKNGRIDEGVGHGTFVASLIVAIAPRARILPIRALDSDSMGTTSQLARAFAMAVARGAKIINFSGGLDRDLKLISKSIQAARNSGCTVVAPAGNRDRDDVDFPARIQGAVAVTSVDLADRKSDFASYGEGVDLCAPGENLLGVHPLSPTGVARWSGTSFATALASGSLALLRSSSGRTLSVDELLDLVHDFGWSVDLMNPAYVGQLGRRIDVDAAAAAIGR